ncbi:hypothetical protein D1AOALGA4SA_4763 [Olavius algarvensis Delta 1 endosymbiont]|nr:hypothetical protein D1AOALGA4SA_4763 [Olavius algarvensis Delta 1 endosymbiont]
MRGSGCGLRGARCEVRVAGFGLRVAGCEVRGTGCGLVVRGVYGSCWVARRAM